MDNLNLPSGYRFRPKDEELVLYYLLAKIRNLQLPPARIHDNVRLYDFSVEQLTERYRPCDEDFWYFLTKNDKKHVNGKRPNRRTKEGCCWKMTSSESPIEFNKVKVGVKFCFAYYSADKKKSEWLMQELVAVDANGEKMDDTWVLCKVYRTPDAERKKRKKDQQPVEQQEEEAAAAESSSDQTVQQETMSTRRDVEARTSKRIRVEVEEDSAGHDVNEEPSSTSKRISVEVEEDSTGLVNQESSPDPYLGLTMEDFDDTMLGSIMEEIDDPDLGFTMEDLDHLFQEPLIMEALAA